MKRLLLFVLTIVPIFPAGAAADGECVVFLHGLSRTASTMEKIEDAFHKAGFTTVNVDYPSRKHDIATLTDLALDAGLDGCGDAKRIHFVTHSLGGILVRYYVEHNRLDRLGRVVMLAPPNQGSEIIDVYGDWPGFELLAGEPSSELGTDENSVPKRLGPVTFELGVIAGDRTFDPLMSGTLPGEDDGKVTIENTKVEGMKDWILVAASHAFIMRSDIAIEQALKFVLEGGFDHGEEEQRSRDANVD